MSHLPSKGEVTPVTTKFATQCGAYGMWTLCYLYPVTSFPSKPSITISWYRVAAWCPTSKVKQKLCYLTERVGKCLTFPRCLTSGSRVEWLCAHSGWTLSMCTICTNFVCATVRGGPCPSYQQGTSKFMVIDLECSQGEQCQEANCLRQTLLPWRKLIPGGLRCLNMREVAPDTPEDPSRSAVRKSFVNWLYSQGEWTVLTFQSTRGMWQF